MRVLHPPWALMLSADQEDLPLAPVMIDCNRQHKIGWHLRLSIVWSRDLSCLKQDLATEIITELNLLNIEVSSEFMPERAGGCRATK